MSCPSCGFDNPRKMKFCGQCGTPLSARCPQCGFENPPGFAFCGQCATPLTGQTSAPSPSISPVGGGQKPRARAKPQEPRTGRRRALSARRGTPKAERRQLTVLFCDLVDSTILSERLDPEELREVVRAYQATCAEVVDRFEGHIAQYLGDGLLVYFGYPLAHEDDATHAVHAGLGIVEAMGKLNGRLQRERGIQLAVRLGVHTGVVVVGEVGGGVRHEQLALGGTPHVAARLQGIADPDTLVISAATYRLVQGYFTCQALGSHTFKGIAAPVLVYRVFETSAAHSRLEVAVTAGLTPLVGREQEVSLLSMRWARVKDGVGQVVWLSGEAGIGKSRMVQELKGHLADEPHTRLELRCSSYHQQSGLYPVIDILQRALQFERDDPPEAKLQKLEEALAAYPISRPEAVPLLAALLSLPAPARYPPLTLTPQRQKQKTLQALLTLLLAMTIERPLLLIVEDLHWIDPSTLELLNLLIDHGPMLRSLTLLTFRPEFQPPWAPRAHLTALALSRLSHAQVEVMVERVAGGKPLPAEVVQQMAARTDGIPLFVEELTKMMLESGWLQECEDRYELAGPLPPVAIPTTLQDSLMARLDRLGPVKEVAQLAATLGREFPYELLRAVSPLDETTLQHALARLVAAELLYQRGTSPQATYLFKHALIQEAAYQSVLKSTRQWYHQQIAQVLAEQFPGIVETQPELLGHHYTEAGLLPQAIPYWQLAGRRATERSANLEAISQLTKGLELLKTLPHTPEHLQQELLLWTTLGPALMATKGFAAPEVERGYARARELCQQIGETPQLFPVLFGLWVYSLVRAELQEARRLGEQLLNLAQIVSDRALPLEAHNALGTTLFYVGELRAARERCEQGLALYDPHQHRSHAFLYGLDPGVVCLSHLARILWLLGYPDQAIQRTQQALGLAQELAHPFSLGFALYNAGIVHQLRGEGQLCQDRAEAVMALSREQEFPFRLATATILRGWAVAKRGGTQEGIAQMRQGLAMLRKTGAELTPPYFLALLAEVYRAAEQTEVGLSVLGEALTAASSHGERYYEAELFRLQGECLLAQGGKRQKAEGKRQKARSKGQKLGEAEACFQQALDLARQQGAKALELRAAMSLSRLWQRHSKRTAAHQLLAEIYGWFTEGFDTLDLQKAKMLLDELS